MIASFQQIRKLNDPAFLRRFAGGYFSFNELVNDEAMLLGIL
jgi:hypothetical protein